MKFTTEFLARKKPLTLFEPSKKKQVYFFNNPNPTVNNSERRKILWKCHRLYSKNCKLRENWLVNDVWHGICYLNLQVPFFIELVTLLNLGFFLDFSDSWETLNFEKSDWKWVVMEGPQIKCSITPTNNLEIT